MEKSCKSCKHARKVVNRSKRDNFVGCMLATKNIEHEEFLINMIGGLTYSMFYKKSKPDQNKAGIMTKGVILENNFTCIEYKDNK